MTRHINFISLYM